MAFTPSKYLKSNRSPIPWTKIPTLYYYLKGYSYIDCIVVYHSDQYISLQLNIAKKIYTYTNLFQAELKRGNWRTFM